MNDAVVVPGGRDVRGSLDGPPAPGGSGGEAVESWVVACPPPPRMGGSRSDPRLGAVSDSLTERGIACLRFDYGPWDGGAGECLDALNALGWADERYDRVGAFGYSFGAAAALVAAARVAGGTAGGRVASVPDAVAAVSALAPPARLTGDVDAVAATDALDPPVQVCYGERDDTVEWEPVVERARERGFQVEAFAADHHFVGQHGAVGDRVGAFFGPALGGRDGDETGR